MIPRLTTLAGAAAIAALFATLLGAEVSITYLANEGVMLESLRTKLLIDSLFRDSLGAYARHSSANQESIETGRAPFNGISLALATHYHLDHWDAGAITRFLGSNTTSLFAGPAAATAMIPSSQKIRVRAFSINPGGSERFEVSGIPVEAFSLQHGNTPHVGYAVSIGGVRVFHLGDADASAANFAELTRLGSPAVAIVPFWWLLDRNAVAFLRDSWKPRQLIAVHFGATDLQSESAVQSAWRGVWTCTKQGESRMY